MTELYRQALHLAGGKPVTARWISRVAAATSAEAAQWAFGQWSLRERAKAKFARAAEMLFDRDGLEMASHEKVAAYHASRFPTGELVVDLTAGIGADLIALAARGLAVGFEIDPVRASYARHNLSVHGLSGEIREEDCLGLLRESTAEYLRFGFCDPARREAGRRALELKQFRPDVNEVAELFARTQFSGIKLSPMLPDRELESFGGKLEFVSFGGECREALVWLGRDAMRGKSAVHVESGSELPAGYDPPQASEFGPILYEADPAAIRAHCLGSLCSALSLEGLGDSNGYLTGSEVTLCPWLTAYAVLASFPADLKRAKAELRRLGGGTPVIKCRGVRLDVEKLRHDLKGPGEELCLITYPEGKKLRNVIARRLS